MGAGRGKKRTVLACLGSCLEWSQCGELKIHLYRLVWGWTEGNTVGLGLERVVSWQSTHTHTYTRHKMTVLLPLGNKVGYQIMRVSLGAWRVALDLKMAQVAKHSIVALFTHHGRRSAMLSDQALASQVAIRGENDLPGRCVWCSYSRYTHNCAKAPKHLYVRYM